MDGIIPALIIGFVIGLSGALAPGPTLVATIRGSLDHGWTAGPRLAAGHAAVEAVLALAIVAGLAAAADSVAVPVAVVGGAALILFGGLTVRESRTAVLDAPVEAASGSPFLAGVVTSAANPYFWLWWLSVGSGLLLEGLAAGAAVAVAFMIGHWASDFGWFGLVAAGTAGGKTVLSVRQYRLVLAACGVFLIFFGASYLWRALPA
ncbi:Lysine exporter protein (LYSE/YGGA) [Methanofollis liminatans DSM 4140]|jgi:threonine/homoserine/homoserine lactone efflux protein|uniref:Lysine exporter protein (LYSE/YGGA) n=1 Tax=Methanofollis liminatans DSM 4140 TaxID=28892 RepID=J0S6A9_9EURY|nr:LysE family transporter [Methanofollis liminatans]EJG06059.1 Lysine exporter protein (LYSE/YGGA) [Methanofollis liminatans DSM 4140]